MVGLFLWFIYKHAIENQSVKMNSIRIGMTICVHLFAMSIYIEHSNYLGNLLIHIL